ncbi:MAG: outer membrane beta-barrel family protein [Bacteroidaceae bacterium]
MKNRIISTLMLALSLQTMNAQQWKVSGQLIDKTNTNKPLEAVEILICKLDGESIYSDFSDGEGKFTIPLATGQFILRYRQLGEILRTDTIRVNKNIDIGCIPLNIKQYTLKEVTVTSQKRMLTRKNGHLVYLVQNSPFANGFSTRDLLHNIPRIDPSSDEIKIIGKSNVLVLVNGHHINLEGKDLDTYLRTLPSEDISKVELITNPSVEYDAGGNCGVINIILKNKPVGLDGDIHSTYTQRSHAALEEGIRLSTSTGNLSLEYRVNNSNEKRHQIMESSYSYKDFSRESESNKVNRYNILAQDLNGNFCVGQFNLGFFASLNRSSSRSRQYGELTTSDAKYPSSDFSSMNKDSYQLFTISPYTEWKLDSLGKKISLNYNYINVGDNIKLDYTAGEGKKYKLNQNDYSYVVNTVNIDANIPFSWLNFELGGKYSHFRTNNSSTLDIVNGFLYKETITSFYADINRYLGAWYAKVGLRYENTKDTGLTQEGIRNKNKYDQWFPFAELSFTPNNNHSFTLGYSKHINRPTMNEMNPTRVYSDNYNYTEGNESLQPSVMDNIEFNYIFKGNLAFDLYYYSTSDAVQMLTSVIDNMVTKSTPVNCLNIKTYGGDVNYSFSFWRFNLYTSLSMYYNKGKSYIREVDDHDLKSLNATASSNLSYQFKATNLYVKYFHVFSGLEEIYHTKSLDCLTLGYKLNLLKNRLIFNVMMQDVFGGTKSRNRVNYTNYVFKNRIDNDNTSLRIGLTYKFGKHKAKKSDISINNFETNRLPDIKK